MSQEQARFGTVPEQAPTTRRPSSTVDYSVGSTETPRFVATEFSCGMSSLPCPEAAQTICILFCVCGSRPRCARRTDKHGYEPHRKPRERGRRLRVLFGELKRAAEPTSTIPCTGRLTALPDRAQGPKEHAKETPCHRLPPSKSGKNKANRACITDTPP